MNKIIASLSGVSLAALFVLWAQYGSAFGEALYGAWLFLLKLSDSAPLGVSSFVFALALAVASQPFLGKWVPALPCHLSRELIVETAALVIAVGVMWVLLPTLNGLLLGLIAGLAAPNVYKALAALIGLVWRRLQKEDA